MSVVNRSWDAGDPEAGEEEVEVHPGQPGVGDFRPALRAAG